ncbi:MAG TPA: N-carbamoylputrescine amidase [Steroidobacteraceae bacterium]|nr:N-carbamoylputrescine amidase [Steroidobacteraceae bacterium]
MALAPPDNALLRVAVIQLSCSWDLPANLDRAERLVREAAARGARLVLLPELFATPYFCIEQDPRYLELAERFADSPLLRRFAALAGELQVVLPLSFFERDQHAFFNSLAMADADGRLLGVYRKSHIPNGPGYQEKFYFSPGDTGFRVWQTRVGRVGVGICWDQWFPESARAMALLGAELLCYPTAIGSEPPPAPPVDSRRHWQRVQQGHAGANLMPLLAANRYGLERAQGATPVEITFYGSSFIADAQGAMLAEAPLSGDTILTADLDLAALRRQRDGWFLFRDRRPDLYAGIASFAGKT